MKNESMSEKITDLKRMALFREVKSKKLSDEVFEQIKALIFKGDLKPGDKFPPERELAQFLNVGRSSLREALIRLKCRWPYRSKENGWLFCTICDGRNGWVLAGFYRG